MSLNLYWPVAALLSVLMAACADHQVSATHEVTSAPETYCKPQYPPAALRAQVQGVTTVAFHLDATGKVTGTEIVKSSGPTPYHRLLDEETARKLSLCPFKPQLDDQGQPVAGIVKVDYRWRLE